MTDRTHDGKDSEQLTNRAHDLDEIVSDYLDALNRGQELDPLEIARHHPDHGTEVLRQLYAFLDLGRQAADQPPLGTLGDYTLQREIGRGGMGVVYEARQESMDRFVALKVLPPGLALDDKAFHRFMREAKTAGRLDHPNVVHVYGLGIEEQTPYYSMELVGGETLAEVLKQVHSLPAHSETRFGRKDEVAYFAAIATAFADVASGLQHAHTSGVVHRDIKPSNLIFDREVGFASSTLVSLGLKVKKASPCPVISSAHPST